MKSPSPVFTLFLFPLITYYRNISFSPVHFRLLGWKKHAPSSLKRKKWWIWNSGHFMILRFVPSASFKFWGVFLENRVILWVFINYSKWILKELFNLQLWSSTFFQHVTVLFHLYAFFKFLESFAHCVPLNASLRTGFLQNENIVS